MRIILTGSVDLLFNLDNHKLSTDSADVDFLPLNHSEGTVVIHKLFSTIKNLHPYDAALSRVLAQLDHVDCVTAIPMACVLELFLRPSPPPPWHGRPSIHPSIC